MNSYAGAADQGSQARGQLQRIALHQGRRGGLIEAQQLDIIQHRSNRKGGTLILI